MASRTLSFSSLASAFSAFPPRSRPPPPPLRLSSGSRLSASPLSTAAAATDADADDGVDTVEQLLVPKPSSPGRGRIVRLMKLQRRADDGAAAGRGRWFPYLDAFRAAGGVELTSREVLEVLESHNPRGAAGADPPRRREQELRRVPGRGGALRLRQRLRGIPVGRRARRAVRARHLL